MTVDSPRYVSALVCDNCGIIAKEPQPLTIDIADKHEQRELGHLVSYNLIKDTNENR